MAVRSIVVALAFCLLALKAETQTIAVRAQNILTISGSSIRNGTVLVRDGKIVSVGADVLIPPGALLMTAHTVMPGLIDIHSHLGVQRGMLEPADSLTPEMRAADAFDPTDPNLLRALHAGVTIAGIMPPNRNVIAGQPAIIRLGGKPTVIRESAGLKISISPESADTQRNPTSRAGIADLLQRTFASAQAGRPFSAVAQTRLLAGGIPTSLSNRTHSVTNAIQGRLPVIIHAPGIADMELALESFAPFPKAILRFAGASDALPLSAQMKARGAMTALGPLRFLDSDRILSQPGRLSRAGMPVAFRTDGPVGDPSSLRMSAHLAVKFGMSRDAALRGLTLTAAEFLGIASQTGSIAPGKDADLLLLTGDPLDLTSRVTAVISGGRIVHKEMQ